MTTYPLLQDPAPWNNSRELGVPITVAGLEILAVPSQNAVTGDLLLGELGFEADDLYILAKLSDVAALGDLHDTAVVIGSDNYLVKSVRPKPNVDLIRIVLKKGT